MTYYTWFTRGVCACGYLWTNAPAQAVQCACGQSMIHEDGSSTAQPVTDEAAFKAAVADDLNVAVEALTLVAGI